MGCSSCAFSGPLDQSTTEVFSSAIYGCGYNSRGCNLRLSEVRSGSLWGRLGPKGFQTVPKSTPSDPDRTSDNLKLQPHEL